MTELNNFYALLIGIDRYEPNPYYKDLKSCVRDIDLVANYVCKSLNVPQKQIWKLTSPFEDTKSQSASRFQEAKPTYENIVNAFQEITDRAKSGEQVYIHYAGHGGGAVTIYPEREGEQRQDERIVPMDIGSSDGRYLRDSDRV